MLRYYLLCKVHEPLHDYYWEEKKLFQRWVICLIQENIQLRLISHRCTSILHHRPLTNFWHSYKLVSRQPNTLFTAAQHSATSAIYKKENLLLTISTTTTWHALTSLFWWSTSSLVVVILFLLKLIFSFCVPVPKNTQMLKPISL